MYSFDIRRYFSIGAVFLIDLRKAQGSPAPPPRIAGKCKGPGQAAFPSTAAVSRGQRWPTAVQLRVTLRGVSVTLQSSSVTQV